MLYPQPREEEKKCITSFFHSMQNKLNTVKDPPRHVSGFTNQKKNREQSNKS